MLENIIKNASQILKINNIDSHRLDAEIILSNIMKIPRNNLILNEKKYVSKKIRREYAEAINRRANKEPVAYILGKKEFWSQEFLINNSTLIPRPETELMIYGLISYFKKKKIRILDIGTGSGCILLAILKELVNAHGIGIDISPTAIKVAIKNAKKLNLLKRSKFKVLDLNKFNHGKYDLIVSNPPYIPSKEIKNLSKDIINYEPIIALNGGLDGLDVMKKVIYKSTYLLKNNGLLAVEIGNQQYNKVSNFLKSNGFNEKSKVYDYNKNVRCIISTKV
jgi:release factor glutamine methyltransferase|tara:strand:- start:2100 stop:2936 length:837 start_codon:yes stop_codon:yes gene_type:complete